VVTFIYHWQGECIGKLRPGRRLISITEAREIPALLLFSAQFLACLGLVIRDKVTDDVESGVGETIISVGLTMGQITVAITAITFIIIEGGAVLADRYLKRQYEKGREEGIRTASEAWEAWNNRRMEAEAKGEPFTEAPPSQLDGGTRGWPNGRR
jgi:hypothetical protein